LGQLVSHPSVNYAATVPGSAGLAAAFVAEVVISFILMSVILAAMASPRLARFTGIFAACLVATFITFEAPISGMSMNPARTFASVTGTRVFDALWIYLVAPPLGMLAAVEARKLLGRTDAIPCAKLHHANAHRCIFRCGYANSDSATVPAAAGARGERGQRQQPLRRHHHRAGGGGRHARLVSRPDREEDPAARARRLRAAGERELVHPRRQPRGPLQHEGGVAHERRRDAPPPHELLRRRQHEILRRGPLPPSPGGLRRDPPPRRGFAPLARLLRPDGALLCDGRSPLP